MTRDDKTAFLVVVMLLAILIIYGETMYQYGVGQCGGRP